MWCMEICDDPNFPEQRMKALTTGTQKILCGYHHTDSLFFGRTMQVLAGCWKLWRQLHEQCQLWARKYVNRSYWSPRDWDGTYSQSHNGASWLEGVCNQESSYGQLLPKQSLHEIRLIITTMQSLGCYSGTSYKLPQSRNHVAYCMPLLW